MRHNGPTTGTEVPIQVGDELVSSTDTRGKIAFCNDTFQEISGFTHEELLNRPHNIIRHPEMPSEVFRQMWQSLKAGHPWMGIIKNRCKNGDHYWVDAYVTPLREGTEIIGYESVRVQADPVRIQRAEKVYQRLTGGKSYCSPFLRLWQRWRMAGAIGLTTALLLMLGGAALGWADGAFSLMALSVGTAVTGLSRWLFEGATRPLLQASEQQRDPLAAYIYTGRSDTLGEIRFAQLSAVARLRTALGRFEESARALQNKASAARDQARRNHSGMTEQQQQTASVANAIEQMSQAVQEVAKGATDTSNATRDAIAEVQQGNQVIEGANGAITELSTTVADLNQVLEQLTRDSGEIGTVIDVIREIAEQTNLLALNAAIEAARAGEQGRGFAVVADEVRTLAQRTQDSTQQTQDIISKLTGATQDASDRMVDCQQIVERSVDEMSNVHTALEGITQAVHNIDQMSHQIAAATEEQSATAVEIERNTGQINEISDRTQKEMDAADGLNQEMSDLSQAQLNLIVRFH